MLRDGGKRDKPRKNVSTERENACNIFYFPSIYEKNSYRYIEIRTRRCVTRSGFCIYQWTSALCSRITYARERCRFHRVVVVGQIVRRATSKDTALFIPRLGRRCRSIGNTHARSRRVFVSVNLGTSRITRPRVLRVNFKANLGTLLALRATRTAREGMRCAKVRLCPLS